MKKSKEKIKVGLQTFGVIRVFVKEKEIRVKGKKLEITEYWTNVSKQFEDESWVNKSFPIYFRKDGPKPEESKLIDISEAWFFLSGNPGYERITLYVNQYDEVEGDDN